LHPETVQLYPSCGAGDVASHFVRESSSSRARSSPASTWQVIGADALARTLRGSVVLLLHLEAFVDYTIRGSKTAVSYFLHRPFYPST
jgi:hypothetical protein